MTKTSCPRDSRDSLIMVTDVTTPSLVGYQLSVIIAILIGPIIGSIVISASGARDASVEMCQMF